MHACLKFTAGMLIAVLAPTLASAESAPPQPTATAPQAVYPAKAQTPEQQAADEAQCQQWAIQQSGYDPAHPPVAAKAQPAPVTGSGARVRGAAAGATVGAIGGNDVGNAAAKGAVVGGVVRRNKNRAAAAQANQAAEQQIAAGAEAFGKARAACLEGRGYTVK